MLAYDKPIIVGAYPKKALNWESILQAARIRVERNSKLLKGIVPNYVTNFAFAEDENGNRLPVQIKDNFNKTVRRWYWFYDNCKKKLYSRCLTINETKYNNDLNIDS